MIWLATILFIIAACAAISATPDRVPSLLMAFYWSASLMGQMFALPLVLINVVLAFVSQGWATGLFASSALLFGFVHWRNRKAGRKLLDAFGAESIRLPPLAGMTPFLTGAQATRRIRNLVYGPDQRRNLLDIVELRVRSAAPRPILIHFHGGAWVSGDTNQQAKPLLNHMAERGWLCFDATYSLGPDKRGPQWIIDVLLAIAWIRTHASEYGGDPARIAITGGSAGGHLAALAALAHDDPRFKPGFEAADCSVSAAVALYGRYDFLDRKLRLGGNHAAVIDKFMARKVMPGSVEQCTDLWHQVSPLHRIRADAPPMLILHGTGDTMLPCEDARDFADALAAVSTAPTRFLALEGIQHGWDGMNSAVTWGMVRAIGEFLRPLEDPDAAAAVRGWLKPASAS